MKHLIVTSSLLAILLAGCAGSGDMSLVDVQKQAFDDLRAEIRIAINDPGRETEAIAIVDELAGELESLLQKKVEKQEQSRKLNANYDTTRAEFDAFVNASNTDVRLNLQRILEQRKALIEITTPEEWIQLLDARTEAIDAAFDSTQSI